MLARDDLFSDVPQYEVTMKGHAFKLPLFYRDASAVTAIFPAKASAVARMMPRPTLRPLLLAPGVATFGITFFDYRDSDIGPYGEIAFTVPVSHGTRPVPLWTVAMQMRAGTLSAWVQWLPVTTEIARVGGVEGYGYPKFVADIEYEVKGDRFLGALHHQGRRVVGLSGELPHAEKTDVPKRYVTYAVRCDRLVEAQVLLRADTLAVGRRASRLHLDLDDQHEIGLELRRVLLGRHPLYVEHMGRFRSILHPPSFLE